MAHLHAHERDLESVAAATVLALTQHPEWKKDALALRDRLDAMIDAKLPVGSKSDLPPIGGTPNPADSPNKAAGGWCERHGGYLGQRCATCALEVADSAPASRPS